MVTEAFICRHTSNYGTATMDNTFLLSNDCTIATCFCQECRFRRKYHFTEMSLYQMYICINALSGVREIRSERLFENTLNQIANGKAYHDACLRGSGLKKWKSWAKKQDQFKMQSLLRQMGWHCQKSIRSEVFKYRGINLISALFARVRKSDLVWKV